MTTSTLWRLPIAHTHQLAGSAGALSFVGGAGDLDRNGAIRHPGDLDRQIAGAIDNVAAALEAESCTLDDVVKLKAFYTAGPEIDDWHVIAAIAARFALDPLPAISTLSVPLQPWAGQTVQIQAIAQRGWRKHADIRHAPRVVPEARRAAFKGRTVTAGLRAGEFIVVSNLTAADAQGNLAHAADGPGQSEVIMQTHAATLAALGASFQDSVKMEGYYFGTTREQWAGMARVRASHFREPGPPATVVTAQRLNPEGAMTKIEVMAMRESWNGFDKYIPREDHWPKRVWDWPIPLPYRQAVGLRNTIWLGGQVPYEPFRNGGRRAMPGQLGPQTRLTMSFVEDLLRAFDRRPADLKLMVCHFTSTGTPEESAAQARLLADCTGGALPPLTLVPQPQMQTTENTVEIWGVADY